MTAASVISPMAIPGLNKPLTLKDLVIAQEMYNNSEHVSKAPETSDAHIWALLNIIERFGLREAFRVHRIHRHDTIPEGTIKMEQSLGIMNGKWNRAIRVEDLDFGNMHSTVFKFVKGHATAYEFAEGPSFLGADVQVLVEALIKDFSLYLEDNGLSNQIALEHGDFRETQEGELLTEVDFDGVGTIALPQSRVRGGPKIITSWNVPPASHLPSNPPAGQTWSPMVNQSHKVFQNKRIMATTPEQVMEELVFQGVVTEA